ncbi:MAG: hypothetical protein FJ077_12405 [Cyanobacteria bacterium K_DeepCast_35m_m2_023]|nr:hypothetical protein [Cyanobacteria bacterium K_DeepCast_35m_m2_023]
MTWDPVVLRKYNTTGHFRLLNQVRSELKSNPLVRPKDGERIADVNRSRALVRALEGRPGAGARSRRGSSRDGESAQTPVVTPRFQDASTTAVADTLIESSEPDRGTVATDSFRDRLQSVELR